MTGAGVGANPPQYASMTDYWFIVSAADPALSANFNDRFCGNEFNAQAVPVAEAQNINHPLQWDNTNQICILRELMRTATSYNWSIANNGFCLRFNY